MLPAPNPIQCKNEIQEVLGTGPATVCLADADGLKGINDKYGHLAGDQYLECVFESLQGSFPEFHWDRYGGDEFIGVSPGEISPNPEQAKRETVQILNQPIKIGYSLGVVHTAPNDTVELAMAMADAAMYEAKHVHHGGLLMFQPVKVVGLILTDWAIEWYIPLVREKIRFFLGYEQGIVDFTFTQNPDIQEGIFVDSPEKLHRYIFEVEKNEPPQPVDEFGEWGMPVENLEWRTKTPESEWEQMQDDQPVKIRLERDGGSVAGSIKPTAKPEPVEKSPLPKKRRFSLPDISIPTFPSLSPAPAPHKPEPKEDNILQGKILWVWGERAHEIDYAFARHLSQSASVLYLDGDFKNPQQPGDWSDCWAIKTPARPPANLKQEGNLTVWGLGKRPPQLRNIKALWENALYSLNTTDKVIIVGAGGSAPPPHVDGILFVTENDIPLAAPAVSVHPLEKPEEIAKKVGEMLCPLLK